MEQVSVQYYHTNRILHGDNNTHVKLEIVFHFLFRVGPILPSSENVFNLRKENVRFYFCSS